MATVAAHNAAPAGSSSTARTPSSNIDVKTVTDHSIVKNKDGFSVRTWAGGNGQFWWGLASAQGRRPNMEDAHLVDLHIDDQGTALFGVFDGHAGKRHQGPLTHKALPSCFSSVLADVRSAQCRQSPETCSTSATPVCQCSSTCLL
eukprot:GHRQ01004936.1.p2 GENE.GHRQ01004936.1~~GHRQ01004936.1.p2  ORF type:complete len:146 (+),score=32.05 GHRQ01004936.1:302-739(+)